MKNIFFITLIIVFSTAGIFAQDKNNSIAISDYTKALSTNSYHVEVDSDQETDQFLKAKGFVLKSDWENAQEHLEKYIEDYPDGKYTDESFYWLAQTINRLSRKQNTETSVIRLKESALSCLDKLYDKYDSSLWTDDAKSLDEEVTAELILIGHNVSRRISHKSDLELKRIGLKTVTNLEDNIVLDLLRRIILEESDIELRKDALDEIYNYIDESYELLESLKENVSSKDLLEQISKMILKINLFRIPVHLNYVVYGATLIDTENLNDFPENKPVEFEISSHKLDSYEGKNEIKRVLDDNIRDIGRSGLGTKGEIIQDFIPKSYKIMNKAGDYYVQFLQNDFNKDSHSISGNIKFQRQSSYKVVNASFEVTDSSDKLIVIRSGDKVGLVVLQFESEEPKDPGKATPMYKTLFNNIKGCIVHSSRGNWPGNEMGTVTTKTVVDFGAAKVEIPVESGRWVLTGQNILLDNRNNQFIARGAELKDEKGQILATGSQIIVPVKNPEKYVKK